MTGAVIVERINALLKDKKIKKAQFYNACGISSAAYSQWNIGKTFPTKATLSVVAEYLGVSVEYLLTGIDPNAQQKKPVPNWDELSDSHKKLIEAVYSMDEASVTRLQLIVDMVLAEREK